MPTNCLPRLEREAAIDHDLLAGDEVGFSRLTHARIVSIS